jgi:hypothetical protein
MTLWALWLGWICERAHRQREAVAAVLAAGGGVQYDDADPNDPFSYIEPDWAAWQWPSKATLRNWFGRDYVDNLVVVVVDAKHFNEALLMRLASLATLRRLDICGPGTTVGAWAHLGKFRSLEELHFAKTGLADGDLIHVSSISSLRDLDLSDTQITDTGLACLGRLDSLRSLDLSRTQITDAGLPCLGRLDSLRRLDLIDTQITDAGLTCLTRLDSLRYWDLSDTRITDVGLPCLGHLVSLESLLLFRTKVTATGLEQHLKGLKSLRFLHLGCVCTTREKTDKLKKVFPSVDID